LIKDVIISILPILKEVDYMQQQMVNFENHQFDVLNEWVDLGVNIVPNAKREKEKFERIIFVNILKDVDHLLIFQCTSLSMEIDELVAKRFQ
jgi:hypothetical protein